MERSTRIVEEGLTLGNDLGSALHKISNVVTEVYKFSQEIGAATNEQSVGSSQMPRLPAASPKSLRNQLGRRRASFRSSGRRSRHGQDA